MKIPEIITKLLEFKKKEELVVDWKVWGLHKRNSGKLEIHTYSDTPKKEIKNIEKLKEKLKNLQN